MQLLYNLYVVSNKAGSKEDAILIKVMADSQEQATQRAELIGYKVVGFEEEVEMLPKRD